MNHPSNRCDGRVIPYTDSGPVFTEGGLSRAADRTTDHPLVWPDVMGKRAVKRMRYATATATQAHALT